MCRLEKRVKRPGAKEEKRRKKCKVRFSLIKKNKAFPKNYMKVGGQEVAVCGLLPARTWEVHASGVAPAERLKLRRQMAAAAGKKSTTSLSFFMEVYGLEVEEELSTLATQYWAEGVWTGKWHHEQREAWMRQIQEVQSWKQVRGPAGAVMCETRDLGITLPHWHTLIFEVEVRIDMRYVCPKRCQENASAEGQGGLPEKVGSKGIWLEPALALLRQKTKGDWTERHRNVARKLLLEGGWEQKRLRHWLVA